MAKRGAKPHYDNPEELADAIDRYFEWVEKTPIYVTEAKTVAQGGNMGSEVEMIQIPRRRYPSLYSLARFLGFRYSSYVQLKEKPEFADILEDAEARVKDEKLQGAAQNEFNSNIVARDIGLRDGQDIDQKVSYKHAISFEASRRAFLDELAKKPNSLGDGSSSQDA